MNKNYKRWKRSIVIWLAILAISLNSLPLAFAQKITIKTKAESLKTVLQQVEKNSNLKFLYADEILKNSVPVSIDVEQKDVKEVIAEIFRQQPLTVQYQSNTVVIKVNANIQGSYILTGRVTEHVAGNNFSGVTLRLQGNNVDRISSTDANGLYSFPDLTVGNYKLTASFIGYDTKNLNLQIKENMQYNLSLVPVEQQLDKVVVIGYGSTRQRDLTSSVSKLDGKKLQDFSNNAATFESILGGAIKGVMVTQNSGEPGSTAKLNIRGITSPISGSSNEPLYVIDGVPFFIESSNVNPLSNIPVSEIESIDILKDAAATAIYGSRGANGVVIVNTKRGQRNSRFTVHADYTHSLSNPIKNYKPLNTEEFKSANATLIKNTIDAINKGEIDPYEAMYVQIPAMESFANITALAYDAYGDPMSYQFDGLRTDAFGSANTDWNKLIQNKNARTSQYNLSIGGGTEQHNLSFNFNGLDQEGLFIHDSMKRYNARIAFDSNISHRFKIGSSLGYSLTKRKDGEAMFTDGNTKPWIIRPDIDPYNPDGSFSQVDGTGQYGFPVQLASPLAQLQNKNNADLSQFLGSFYTELEVFKNFKLRGDVSIASYLSEGTVFSPKVAQDDFSALGSALYSSLGTNASRNTNTSLNFRADYNWTKADHHIKAMAGFGYDRYYLTSNSANYEDFPDDDVLINIQSAARVNYYSSNKLDRGLNAMYSRLNYKFKDTYLAEVNFRTDRSSKFGPGNQRAYFPSASFGWRISNEAFLANVHNVNDLKLRLSWGNTGSTNISDFLYRQFFVRQSNNLWGGLPSVVLESTLPNRDVKWEKTREYNAGLDFSLFGNRLTGSLDIYNRYTEGALSPAPAPLESGFKNFYSNLIDISNRGVEIDLGYEFIRQENFAWSASINLSRNKNRIEKLNGANINAYQLDSFIEGHPAGTLKGYRVEKVFNDQAELDALNTKAQELGFANYQSFSTGLGDYKYIDINGDGRINSDDRSIIASPEPKFFGGFYSTMQYKNFSFSFVMQFSKGAKALMNNFALDSFGILGQSIHRETFENMWTPENPQGDMARLVYYDPSNNFRTSDRLVYETSFLRMKNINLAYKVPTRLTNKWHIESASIFASMSNLFTLTKWPGLDPELVGQYVTTATSNSDPYPLSKTFSLGLSVGF